MTLSPEAQAKLKKAISSFSYTKLSTYFSCGRFWFLTYCLDQKAETHPAATKGIRMHEFYEKLGKAGKGTPEYEAVANEFKRQFPLGYMKYEKVWRPYEQEKFPQGPNTHHELEITLPYVIDTEVGKFEVKLKGKIDYANLNGVGKAIIVDYKAGKHLESPDYMDQAAIYAMMAFLTFKDVQAIETLIFDISDDNLDRGAVESRNFMFTRADNFDSLKQVTDKLISSVIVNAVKGVFPATPGFKCGICPDLNCKFNKSKSAKSKPMPSPKTEDPPVVQELIANKDEGIFSANDMFSLTTIEGAKEKVAELKGMLLQLETQIEKVESANEPARVDEGQQDKGPAPEKDKPAPRKSRKSYSY